MIWYEWLNCGLLGADPGLILHRLSSNTERASRRKLSVSGKYLIFEECITAQAELVEAPS